jgi:hypothetical protein
MNPLCLLSATPNTIPQLGATTTLSWVSTDASTTSIDNGIGDVSPVDAGSIIATPTHLITTYTMTAVGPDGSSTCSAIVQTAGQDAGSALWNSVASTTFGAGGLIDSSYGFFYGFIGLTLAAVIAVAFVGAIHKGVRLATGRR